MAAYTRGKSKENALEKMRQEVIAYLKWQKVSIPTEIFVEIVQEKCSDLNIADADSDVIFETETLPLKMEEYIMLKQLALKSAEDFLELYLSIPNADISSNLSRKTFYWQGSTNGTRNV